MTLVSAHPHTATAAIYTGLVNDEFTYFEPIRRIAGMTAKFGAVDILRNNARIVRESWAVSISVGNYTVAVTLRGN